MRTTYVPEEFGVEVEAPSGYYVPLEEAFIEHGGRRLLYVLGSYCVEASCCGRGSWNYLRVEGYVVETEVPPSQDGGTSVYVDTIDDADERAAVSSRLLAEYPGVRIEFR